MEISKELEHKIHFLLSKGKKIEAVKLVKSTTNCGLKEAKDFVDSFSPAQFRSSEVPTPDMEVELRSLVQQGKKIEAVKLYKDRTGAGLKDSLAYIESLIEKAKPLSPNPGIKSRETQLEDIVKQQEKELKPRSGCFIATACYGDYSAPEVLVLRTFRDQKLMTSVLGRAFVRFYYVVSPFFARQLDRSDVAKHLLRKHLLNGMVNRLSNKRK